jgi:hypothetical protein
MCQISVLHGAADTYNLNLNIRSQVLIHVGVDIVFVFIELFVLTTAPVVLRVVWIYTMI